jgi:membrane-associated HD superfamily phosphohydrolase
MLADSLENAYRGIAELDAETVETLVDTVIFKKLAEYQFDECGINQGDLKRIKEVFADYYKRRL